MVLNGKYDKDHVISIYRIGLAHAKAGVPERLMIMNMRAFMREIIRVLSGHAPTLRLSCQLLKPSCGTLH